MDLQLWFGPNRPMEANASEIIRKILELNSVGPKTQKWMIVFTRTTSGDGAITTDKTLKISNAVSWQDIKKRE